MNGHLTLSLPKHTNGGLAISNFSTYHCNTHAVHPMIAPAINNTLPLQNISLLYNSVCVCVCVRAEYNFRQSDFQAFLFNKSIPLFRKSVSGFKKSFLTFRNPVSGFKMSVSKFRASVSEFRNPVSGFRKPVSRFRNPVSGFGKSVSECKKWLFEAQIPCFSFKTIFFN